MGVEELGVMPLASALAYVEKNQNAVARFGRSAAASATKETLSMRNVEVDLMEKQGNSVGLSNTKMA